METLIKPDSTYSNNTRKHSFAIILGTVAMTLMMVFTQSAAYGANTVPVGNLANVSVFADVNLNNNGNSTISGDVNVNLLNILGISLPVGIRLGGLTNLGNGVSAQAKVDCDVALNNARSRGITANITADFGGRILTPGVYSGNLLTLNGVLILDAQHDPNAVFILNARTGINIGANAVVKLINGANSGRVFWTTAADATIGVNANFVGRLLSVGNILAKANAVVRGSLLSCDGEVTLNTNTINTPPIIGADVEVNIPAVTVPSIPVGPEAVATTTPVDPFDPGVTDTPTTVQSETGGALGEAVDSAFGSSNGANRTSAGSGGILAYTGRNALAIFAIGAGLAGAGWALAVQFKRRRLSDTEL